MDRIARRHSCLLQANVSWRLVRQPCTCISAPQIAHVTVTQLWYRVSTHRCLNCSDHWWSCRKSLRLDCAFCIHSSYLGFARSLCAGLDTVPSAMRRVNDLPAFTRAFLNDSCTFVSRVCSGVRLPRFTIALRCSGVHVSHPLLCSSLGLAVTPKPILIANCLCLSFSVLDTRPVVARKPNTARYSSAVIWCCIQAWAARKLIHLPHTWHSTVLPSSFNTPIRPNMGPSQSPGSGRWYPSWSRLQQRP